VRNVAKTAITAALAALSLGALALTHSPGVLAANEPYAHLPSIGDRVRFDGSAGGEKMAWAYPALNNLEAFLHSTIDAALTSTSYDDYQKKMHAVLARSLTLANGVEGTVHRVQRFSYRGHQDVEVQVGVTTGPLKSAVVWTTPAELVDASGHKYLR
jgi:hypothetical protein